MRRDYCPCGRCGAIYVAILRVWVLGRPGCTHRNEPGDRRR